MSAISLTVDVLSSPRHKVTFWPEGIARIDCETGERRGSWLVRTPRLDGLFELGVEELVGRNPKKAIRGRSRVLTVETETGFVKLDATQGNAQYLSLVLEGLTAIADWVPLDPKGEMDWSAWADGHLLFLVKTTLVARGLATKKGIVVLAGSVASPTTNASLQSSYQAMRAELLDDGSFSWEEDGTLRVSRHLFFSAPSAAASVLCGANTNGQTAWRDEAGRTWSALDLG